MKTIQILGFVTSCYNVIGFGISPILRSPMTKSCTELSAIRCYDKYYQLEEMEDRDTCTTELFLRADGVIEFGDTDGPKYMAAAGSWSVPPGTNDYNMVITRVFSAGSESSDMGEFTFELTKFYKGDMTKVGESVAVTGVMSTSDTFDNTEVEVGYFNMIDATDERLGYEQESA